MSKVYLLIMASVLCLSFAMECDADFSCRAIADPDGPTYSLELTQNGELSEDFLFELHDLNSGKVLSKNQVRFTGGEKKVVFAGVKPSVYTVYFSSSNCKKRKSIKGKGIVLE